jgi:hypothetical protein
MGSPRDPRFRVSQLVNILCLALTQTIVMDLTTPNKLVAKCWEEPQGK